MKRILVVTTIIIVAIVSEAFCQCPEDPGEYFDQILGSYMEVEAKSNGDRTANLYCSLIEAPHQCLIYVQRFFSAVFNQPFVESVGTADDMYEYAQDRPTEFFAYPNDGSVPPLTGDILCFDGAGVGHVSIVTFVDYEDGRLGVIEQNWNKVNCYRNNFTFTNIDGNYSVTFYSSQGYYVEGWARAKNMVVGQYENEPKWQLPTSQAIAECYNRNGGLEELGKPYDDGSGLYVHPWSTYSFLVQNFNNGTWGNCAIVMRQTWTKAYSLHGAFWWDFWYNNVAHGLPISNEYADGNDIYQDFEDGKSLHWNKTWPVDHTVEVFNTADVHGQLLTQIQNWSDPQGVYGPVGGYYDQASEYDFFVALANGDNIQYEPKTVGIALTQELEPDDPAQPYPESVTIDLVEGIQFEYGTDWYINASVYDQFGNMMPNEPVLFRTSHAGVFWIAPETGYAVAKGVGTCAVWVEHANRSWIKSPLITVEAIEPYVPDPQPPQFASAPLELVGSIEITTNHPYVEGKNFGGKFTLINPIDSAITLNTDAVFSHSLDGMIDMTSSYTVGAQIIEPGEQVECIFSQLNFRYPNDFYLSVYVQVEGYGDDWLIVDQNSEGLPTKLYYTVLSQDDLRPEIKILNAWANSEFWVGDNVVLGCNVMNGGDQDIAAPFWNIAYIPGCPLQAIEVPNLPRNSIESYYFEFGSLPEGVYTAKFEADSTDNIVEYQEADNGQTVIFTVEQPSPVPTETPTMTPTFTPTSTPTPTPTFTPTPTPTSTPTPTATTTPTPVGPPDLVVSSITFSPADSPLITGNTYEITAAVKNIGAGPAGPFTTQFRLGGETYPKLYSFDGLESGQTITVSRNFTPSRTLRYGITITADIDDQVVESIETNNKKLVVISAVNPTPPPEPDLEALPPVVEFPFFDGFETLDNWDFDGAGNLPNWGLRSNLFRNKLPVEGNHALFLGDSTNSSYATTYIQRTLNLGPMNGLAIEWDWLTWSLYGSEYIRLKVWDGQWHTIVSYNSPSWQHQFVDLSSYNLIDGFIVRFEAYMDYPESSDAAYLDNLIITAE